MMTTITAVLLLPCAIVACLMSRFYSAPEHKHISTIGILECIAMYGILLYSTLTIYALTAAGAWIFIVFLLLKDVNDIDDPLHPSFSC